MDSAIFRADPDCAVPIDQKLRDRDNSRREVMIVILSPLAILDFAQHELCLGAAHSHPKDVFLIHNYASTVPRLLANENKVELDFTGEAGFQPTTSLKPPGHSFPRRTLYQWPGEANRYTVIGAITM